MNKKVLGFLLIIGGATFSTISMTLFRGTNLFYIIAILALVMIICGLIVSIMGYAKKK